MTKTFTLSYTPAEALDMIKEYYPKTWEDRLLQTTIGIHFMAHAQSVTAQKAYSQLMAITKDMTDIIELVAARHFLNLDLQLFQIRKLQEKQREAGLQAAAMEVAEFIGFDDKKTLRSHYQQVQADYQKEIDNLSTSPTANQ